jgi:hypothetical protein
VKRSTLIILIVLALLIVGLLVWLGLLWSKSKKDDDGPVAIPPPPPPGAASRDELSTGLGQARGLDEGLAPSSVKWTRVFVLDDNRALLTGSVVNETIGLFTDDAGKTWKSFRAERDLWASWSVGLDGSMVVATGSREGAPTAKSARVEGTRVAFGAFDAELLNAPQPLFPTVKGPATGLLQIDTAIPALLSRDSAAMVVEEKPRKLGIIYGGKPGAVALPPQQKLPAGEKIVPVPYARPPLLLSIKGRDLLQRPFPAGGKPLDKPQKIAGPSASATLLSELSAQPMCDTGPWSFQKVSVGKKLYLFGISPEKVAWFPMPDSTLGNAALGKPPSRSQPSDPAPSTAIGCGANRIVIEAIQAKTGVPATWKDQPDVPVLVTCDLDGKCISPKNAPFRVWAGEHQREIAMAATEQGTLGVMTARAGQRWGLYLAQSQKGRLFERQRVIGEGTTDRGRIELGALISFGKRAVLLISADVTGTSRRGWFVLVSDDGGTTWEPP